MQGDSGRYSTAPSAVSFDPSRGPLEKLNRDKRVNRALLVLGMILAIIGFILIKDAVSGHYSRGGLYVRPTPAFKPWGIAGVTIGAVFLLGGFCFRNYYKIDFANRNLCYRVGFLWLKSESVSLPYKFISAITAQGRKVQNKYSSWWTYRVVAISSEGKVQAISDWRREECSECNEEASSIAQRLNCKYYISAPRSRLKVSMQGGAPCVEFLEPRMSSVTIAGIIILGLLAVLWIVGALVLKHWRFH
jgi:hypothetical protein